MNSEDIPVETKLSFQKNKKSICQGTTFIGDENKSGKAF